jgi:[ribosomal protein S5]-alanine N-acetyltransferase
MTDLFDFTYFPRLETERLVLREITTYDVENLYTLFSDPEVTRYNDVETFTEISDAGWVVSFLQDRFDRKIGLRWAVCLKEDEDSLIGTCGYNNWARRNNCGEIGYDLMRRYWGQGIMPEAVGAIVRFGFEQMLLNRVEADVTIGNDASARVLLKLGFTEEGTLRQRGYWKGKYHDQRFFSLLRSEHEAR